MRGVPDEKKEKIAEIYFEWKSDKKIKLDGNGNPMMNEKRTAVLHEYDGYFHYYDSNKDNGEGEKRGGYVKAAMPFRFIPLENLVTIKGFNKALKSGIFSNEIKDITHDELIVKTWKNGEFAKGLYKDIKGKIKEMGGKYGNSLYIGYYIGEELKICNIQIHGASLNPFIEYITGKTDESTPEGKLKAATMKAHPRFTEEGAMQVKSFTIDTTGDNEYTSPVFEELVVSKESLIKADEIGKVLSEKLKRYFDKKDLDTVAENDENLGIKPNLAAAISDARPAAPEGWEYDEEGNLIQSLPF